MAAQRRFWLACGVAAGLCGCTVGPDYQFPEVAVPALFGSASREVVSQDTAPQPEAIRWWQTLHDPELTSLVERAIACNLDIEIALTRMQAVRTQQIVVVGAALPTVDASAGIAAGTGSDLMKGRVPQPLDSGTNTTGLQNVSRVAGFDTGWELDLWGKYKRQLEAVRGEAEAYAEIRNAVLISVISDVVRNYVILRGLQQRLHIAQTGVTAARKIADVAQERFNRGLTNELDVTLAKRELASALAVIPDLTAAISHQESLLGLLLGTFSSDIIPELRKARPLPRVPSRLRTGLPVELLRRRPDIRISERQLAAATARIGLATAALFPTVTFTAGFGVQGGERSTSKSAAAPLSGPIWSAGPGGYWPLLDFGRLDALINIQELAAHESLVNYKRTILVAVEEVDDAIKQYRAQQQRYRELQVALEQARKSVTLATERYERGLTDFLYVLDAQRQEFAIEDQTAIAQEAVVIQYVALYKALGGGWELYNELPPLRDPKPAIVATVDRLANDWH
jgi:NodT family efflux transporter outer membrane factor (OMF) lipoprotein